MASLRALGIRTIISVDGSAPDVQAARSRGMRYVHLPTGYDGIPRERQRQLARAVRDLPRPVYIHCHHGQHRGPAATASVGVVLGLITPDQGIDFLKAAGTSELYAGLFSCVRKARPVDRASLDAVPADFPELARVDGLVGAMVEIDSAFEHLQLVQRAGWRVPNDHPDLVPQAEAQRLAVLLEGLLPRSPRQGDAKAFRELLSGGAGASRRLVTLLTEDSSSARNLNDALAQLKTSCRDCHAQFRDRPMTESAAAP